MTFGFLGPHVDLQDRLPARRLPVPSRCLGEFARSPRVCWVPSRFYSFVSQWCEVNWKRDIVCMCVCECECLFLCGLTFTIPNHVVPEIY